MSAVTSPFGFRPAFHTTGNARGTPYQIASGYATSIFKNQPVILNTNGTITAGTPAADLLGVFAGVEYVDANGRPQASDFWTAGTVATQVRAYVYDEPNTVYEVQADGPVLQTAVGDQADVTNVTVGSTSNGLSGATLSSALVGAAIQGQFRIVGFSQALDNAVGDAFTVVQVRIARHQYVAAKVAI